MKDTNLPPTLQMGMRSSVNVSSEVLGALLETPALHALLDSFGEALIVTDGEGQVRFINLAAERVNRLSKQQAVGLSESDFFQRSALNYDDFLAALNRGGNSALTRSREGRVLLSSTHAIPTGAYEKPFRMLTQKDFDASQPQRRASLNNRPLEPQGLRDPQDNALHLSPQLSSIADTGVRAFRRRARLLLLGEPGLARPPLPGTFIVRPAGAIVRSSTSIAGASPRACSSPRCSATSAAPSPAPWRAASKAISKRRRAARCSSTRSVRSRCTYKPSC